MCLRFFGPVLEGQAMKKGLCTFIGHKYDEWHCAEEDVCVENRTCKRCSHTKSRPCPHIYGDWKYDRDDSCKQVKYCLRCGAKTTQTFHEFSDWIEVEDESYNKIRTCARCGLEEYM